MSAPVYAPLSTTREEIVRLCAYSRIRKIDVMTDGNLHVDFGNDNKKVLIFASTLKDLIVALALTKTANARKVSNMRVLASFV
jgi:hypothetical protein